MIIIPSIYILDGKVVALYKGSFEQMEHYSETPLEMALKFEKHGADKLYLVDLNGKKEGGLAQGEVVREIVERVGIPVILEDGLLSMESLARAFETGVAQVVLRSPTIEFVKEALAKYGPEKIIVQLYSRKDELIEKRQPKFEGDYTDVVDYAEKLVPLGVKYIIYKDVLKEGVLIHPNYDEIDRLNLVVGGDFVIYCAGGISDVRHLKILEESGAEGAIIGKAFYEHLLTVEEAEGAVE